MLLKIYTKQHTIKIISDVEDVEIHRGHRTARTWRDIYNMQEPTIRGSTHFPSVDNYDWGQCSIENPPESIDSEISPSVIPDGRGNDCDVKLVDYKKNGEWRRVAIMEHAYLCNDGGKTIEKID